jgi:hypothetical protein
MRAEQRRAATEDQRLACWRQRQLEAAGFPLRLAAAAARDASFDLHALIELVERGCPPALAVRILAPLDVEGIAATLPASAEAAP